MSCCVLYKRASLSYKQGCLAHFMEKQRGVSICMPLRHQSVCRLLSQRLQDRIKHHISKSILSFSSQKRYFLPVNANLPPRLKLNLLLLIQTLDFILQNPVCAQHYYSSRICIYPQSHSSFHSCSRPLLCQSALLSIYLLSSKIPTRSSANKKNLCTA